MMSTHIWSFLIVCYLIFFLHDIHEPAAATNAFPPLQFPCKPPFHSSHPFCNTSLPIPSRAQSLLSLLTLHEKIRQLSNNASAVPRLGLPSYEWWSEALHGVASNGPGVYFAGPAVSAATSFPQVLLAAAAFNRTLWRAVASAIAAEARAMYNVGQAGLTFWAPSVNIFRDPRWGRGQETPGEDPAVAAAYAAEFVKGFQGQASTCGDSGEGIDGKRALESVGDGESELMVSACCKHFTAYDLELWGNFSRYSFDAVVRDIFCLAAKKVLRVTVSLLGKVSEQDLEDTYQPPFRSCIQEGRASCLMCSYNRLNGVPSCARQDILEKARREWGFNGYITSDCDAVATIYEYQKYVNNPEDAVSDVLKAGMDINCGTFLLRHTLAAIRQGKVLEEDIDRALFNLFSVQLRLGYFNGDPRKGQFGKLGTKDVCTLEHRKLALEAAKQGIVLLKNDKRFLPLEKGIVSSLAVIGPLATDAIKLLGGYSGVPCRPKSLYEGLQKFVKETYYAAGCLNVSCISDAGFDFAIQIAQKSNIAIVVAGLDLSQETEDHDRQSLLLPGKQMTLVSSVASASKNPVILVLVGGGPLDVSFAKTDPRIASILWVGYPGEAGGKALAQIIFGDVNPGGRLPMTWYPESFTTTPMNDMSMRSDPSRGYPGRTYRFYTGDSVFDFGHGLSYSSFTYKLVSAPNSIRLLGNIKSSSSEGMLYLSGNGVDYVYINDLKSCSSVRFYVQISVTNVGNMGGSHVVMLYSRAPKYFGVAPVKQLVGFSRVHTEARKTTDASVVVDPCEHLSFANEAGKRILALGSHVLMLGEVEYSVSIQI